MKHYTNVPDKQCMKDITGRPPEGNVKYDLFNIKVCFAQTMGSMNINTRHCYSL